MLLYFFAIPPASTGRQRAPDLQRYISSIRQTECQRVENQRSPMVCCVSILGQRLLQHARYMNGFTLCAVADLLPATGAICNDQRILVRGAHRW